MGNSQDARNPFEPRITNAYTHYDPITGKRDRVGDENLRRKIPVVSSITQGAAVYGTDKGTIFADVAGTALVIYTDDGSVLKAALA